MMSIACCTAHLGCILCVNDVYVPLMAVLMCMMMRICRLGHLLTLMDGVNLPSYIQLTPHILPELSYALVTQYIQLTPNSPNNLPELSYGPVTL